MGQGLSGLYGVVQAVFGMASRIKGVMEWIGLGTG